MSVKVIGEVWDLAIPSHQKFVLLAYADHADHEGRNVFPSVALIAKKCGISERQVQTIVKQLAENRYMIRENSGKGGRGVTTCWRICTAPASQPEQSGESETALPSSPFRDGKTTKPASQFPEAKWVKSNAKKVKFATQKGDVCDTAHNRDAGVEPSRTAIEPSAAAMRLETTAAAAESSFHSVLGTAGNRDQSARKHLADAVPPGDGLEVTDLLTLDQFMKLSFSKAYEIFRIYFPHDATDFDLKIESSNYLDPKNPGKEPIQQPFLYFRKRMIETLSGNRAPLELHPRPCLLQPKLAKTSLYRPFIGD